MEEVITKNKCTGCSACMNICPKNAISMEIDENGFKYPIIDQTKCIDCGLCKKTCPVLNNKVNESINKCYVGFNKSSESRMNKASSGSIFELIAKEVLKDEGIVIGAAFDSSNKLNHIAIRNLDELYKLKGSKYLQSNLNSIFKIVKEYLSDKKVLFVGVPCQVAGLKAYLKKEYDNLICIDLVCHGVPSPKLFNKYIKELEDENKCKVLDYNFRDKSTGWDSYSNTITLENKKITELQFQNDYMKIFLSDIALRESCYNCNFKLGNKYSDITLGDFWGVQKYYPEMYNKEGVSAIIINTEKGNNIFNSIKDFIEYKNCNLEEIVEGNPSLQKSGKLNIKRKEFFNDLDKSSVHDLVIKYVPKKSFIKKVVDKIKKIIKKIIKNCKK